MCVVVFLSPDRLITIVPNLVLLGLIDLSLDLNLFRDHLRGLVTSRCFDDLAEGFDVL